LRAAAAAFLAILRSASAVVGGIGLVRLWCVKRRLGWWGEAAASAAQAHPRCGAFAAPDGGRAAAGAGIRLWGCAHDAGSVFRPSGGSEAAAGGGAAAAGRG